MFLDIDKHLASLNIALVPDGSIINEGFVSHGQKQQFIDALKGYEKKRPIELIVEIGFNAGHSAETLINHCPNLKRFISFDLNCHSYTDPARRYFEEILKDKFVFIPGNSQKTVPIFTNHYPNILADLIYIDGFHGYYGCFLDIIQSHKLAHANTILWIDDVTQEYDNCVGRAVRDCEHLGIIKILNRYQTNEPGSKPRGWVEASFCF